MKHIERLIKDHPELAPCAEAIEGTVTAILESHRNGGKLLLCGNGGSAADSSHIAGEMLKGFLLKREPKGEELERLCSVPELADYAKDLQQGICAVSLPDQGAVLSAYSNDCKPEAVYAQLVYAMGRKGDVCLGMSTSGNSKNILLAIACAKANGLVTVGMTGMGGGKMASLCDMLIAVPETETYRVQELHLPVYHAICAQVEEDLFGENA